MDYQPQNFSGTALRAARWAIQQAGAERAWNLQSFYNGACVAGPCHKALSPGRLRRGAQAAAARQQAATGVWDTFATTVTYDVRRGAQLASAAARPITLAVDALAGTGRSLKPQGCPEERMLRTVDSVGSHFTHTGVLGGVLLGTMLATAVVGAAFGAFYGAARGAYGIPMAWVLDRQAPWVTVGRAIARGAFMGAGQAVMAEILLLWAQVQGVRLGTAGVKLGVAALGALVGLAVGLPHGLAAAYSVRALQPQGRAELALP